MDKETRKRKARLGVEWIRSPETGVSYLCPLGSIRDRSNVSEQELRQLCVDESKNPQND